MKGKVMSYIRRKGAVFVLLLVFSIVFCGIHPVSAESRTQDVYKPYDASVQSGSAAYGFTDGDKWGAVYEKITGEAGTKKISIWYSADGVHYYLVETSKEYKSGIGYVYTFKANGEVMYEGQNGKMDAAMIAKLYDAKLTKTIYSGKETVNGKTFDGPVEVEAGANINFVNCKFDSSNSGLTTFGTSNVSNSEFTDCTAVNKGNGVTYISDTSFGHVASSSNMYGSTSSVVGVKLKSNRLSDAVKGKPYSESLIFPDFPYTYYPGSFGQKTTVQLHYDRIGVIGTLSDGLSAEAAKHDETAKRTVVDIKGTPSKEGTDQRFSVRFQEDLSKLDITVPMLINVNTYSLEYRVIGDSPAGFTVPNKVTGLGHEEVVNLNKAPKRIVAPQNGENGVWEFTGWSTDKDNLDTSIVESVKVTKDEIVYGKWKFTPMKKLHVTKKWEGKKQREAYFLVEKILNGKTEVINQKDGNGSYIPYKIVTGSPKVVEVENENGASYRIIETDNKGVKVKDKEITLNGTKYAVSYKLYKGGEFEITNREIVNQNGGLPHNKSTNKTSPKTGDDNIGGGYLFLLCSASVILGLVKRRKMN
ncbi:SHIRT domain-containing protein [Mogibacterium timidum]|uniref:SHIRT domain-containing protein n=1 Tax=Mogibacterium timidum TaxID=35519 RepID=UPI0028E49161|nr:SHIRT domain-containing protein [Mogibacterium timidum]